jgi:hypothetical protein
MHVYCISFFQYVAHPWLPCPKSFGNVHGTWFCHIYLKTRLAICLPQWFLQSGKEDEMVCSMEKQGHNH